MKVETNHKTDFKPIELKITIESKEELESLFVLTYQTTNEFEKIKNDAVKNKYKVENASMSCISSFIYKISDLQKSC